MSNLAQLTTGSTTPTITQIVASNPVVEPLDGPVTVDDVMDRFPEEIYQQGHDTHLYKFMTALCGDAGSGLIKKQLYAARLRFEAEFINFHNLDDFYATQFQLRRLADETYAGDPIVDALTPEQFDTIELADQSFYQRAQEFFTAIRYGNSPQGLVTMAQAGSGVDADIIEHYKYIFDQYSDDPLGLEPHGTTLSTSEFVISSRFLGADTDRQYTQPWQWTYEFTPPTLTSNAGRPVPAPAGGDVMAVAKTYANTDALQLVPEVERNTLELLDQLRPATTLATINPQTDRYVAVSLNSPPFASSERVVVSQFITGNINVNWPDVDPSQGYFIQAGAEAEATAWYGSLQELPIIFIDIPNLWAYTEQALADPDYAQDDFYLQVNGIAPVDSYASEHYGGFFQLLIAIFPSLASVTPDAQFLAENAVAIQTTPVVMIGPTVT